MNKYRIDCEDEAEINGLIFDTEQEANLAIKECAKKYVMANLDKIIQEYIDEFYGEVTEVTA